MAYKTPAGTDPWQNAVDMYPWLARIPHVLTPGGRNLETFNPEEEGTFEQPRPSGLPRGQYGIELRSTDVHPTAIAGDAVSHILRFTDPQISQYYQQFSQSITPWQERQLQDMYGEARREEGENRPYSHWREMSGLPGYFRGYPFRQLGDLDPTTTPARRQQLDEKYYTGEQRDMFDQMMRYLSTLK